MNDLSTCSHCGGFADGKRVRLFPGGILSLCERCAKMLGQAWLAAHGG